MLTQLRMIWHSRLWSPEPKFTQVCLQVSKDVGRLTCTARGGLVYLLICKFQKPSDTKSEYFRHARNAKPGRFNYLTILTSSTYYLGLRSILLLLLLQVVVVVVTEGAKYRSARNEKPGRSAQSTARLS